MAVGNKHAERKASEGGKEEINISPHVGLGDGGEDHRMAGPDRRLDELEKI